MASNNRAPKKTYVSTFSMDLKSSRSPQVVTVHVGQRLENGVVQKSRALAEHEQKKSPTGKDTRFISCVECKTCGYNVPLTQLRNALLGCLFRHSREMPVEETTKAGNQCRQMRIHLQGTKSK